MRCEVCRSAARNLRQPILAASCPNLILRLKEAVKGFVLILPVCPEEELWIGRLLVEKR